MLEYNHTTVLLKECIDNLNIIPNGIYVDATLGGGGHSLEILKKLNNEGKLICFDQDIIAINNAKIKFKDYDNVILINDNFTNLNENLSKHNITSIDGILYDLGVSSMQIDKSERGFSYVNDGPLDMRMNVNNNIDAKYIVNNYPISQLIKIFEKYGEEKNAKKIAREIISTREVKEIQTTKELSDIILNSISKKDFYNMKSHPSIRVFQALRIEVNKELEVFENSLRQALDIMNDDGRICVISFHSLEDRICKYVFKEFSEVSSDLKKLPVIPKEYLPKYKIINKKPIVATKDELENNNRSHSAKLRVLKREV